VDKNPVGTYPASVIAEVCAANESRNPVKTKRFRELVEKGEYKPLDKDLDTSASMRNTKKAPASKKKKTDHPSEGESSDSDRDKASSRRSKRTESKSSSKRNVDPDDPDRLEEREDATDKLTRAWPSMSDTDRVVAIGAIDAIAEAAFSRSKRKKSGA
jgi:cobalamin biosynthesis Mg chelatase CobN